MGARISSTFQNIIEQQIELQRQQLRSSQSIIVHLVRIEDFLREIRNGISTAEPIYENETIEDEAIV